MSELDLKIIHRPGVDNVAADVLSRYGIGETAPEIVSAQHCLADARVARDVQ